MVLQKRDIGAIVLAAGLGKRMKSKLIKILHPLCGKPMIAYVLDLLEELNVDKRVIIIGHQKEKVIEFLDTNNKRTIEVAIQEAPLGTGDAVRCAIPVFNSWAGDVLILSGDTPLLSCDTLTKVIQTHQMSNAEVTILTVDMDNPTGYGRIIKDSNGCILKIVEETDATPEERRITTVNTGTYCFKSYSLFSALDKISSATAQGEYYLTDVIEILQKEGKKIVGVSASSAAEVMGINSRKELAIAEKHLRKRILERLMLAGVTIVDPDNVFIDSDVEIGKDTVIYPFTTISGKSKIGEDCIIGPYAYIHDTILSNKVKVIFSSVIQAVIKEDTEIINSLQNYEDSRIKKLVLGKKGWYEG